MGLRDAPPTAGLTTLTLLAFAGGFICGVILVSATRSPVRVVRLWSVPPDAIPVCDTAPDSTKGAH